MSVCVYSYYYFQLLSVSRFVFMHSIPARTLESNSLRITFLVPTDQPVCKIIISESYINLWARASLFMGDQLGKLEWAHLPRTLRYGWKGPWRWSVSLCGSSVKGTWRGGSLAGNPEGCVEKVLETGISFHWGPVWGTWRGARLTGTLWWMKGALEMEHLSKKRPRGGGLGGGRGRSFTRGSGRCVKKGSGYGHLSP